MLIFMANVALSVSMLKAGGAGIQATRPADPQQPVITAAPAVPDPSYARLMSPAEFTASDLPVRRRVMAAWAAGPAEGTGPALLPLLTAGLIDPDREVRSQALRVLDRIELHAFSNRIATKPVITDPSTHPPIYDALVRMLDDPEPSARSSAVAGLSNLDSPPQERLEAALLTQLAKEPVSQVRERIVVALTARAAGGSAPALSAILGAMDDENVDVRFRALSVMQRVRRPEALPRVLKELEAPEAGMRLASVRVLAAFGSALSPYRDTLQQRLAVETNSQIKGELERLILLVGPGAPPPPQPTR